MQGRGDGSICSNGRKVMVEENPMNIPAPGFHLGNTAPRSFGAITKDIERCYEVEKSGYERGRMGGG
jgi:hypothetical protein